MKLLPSTLRGRILHNPVSLQPTHFPLLDILLERGLLYHLHPGKLPQTPKNPWFGKRMFLSDYRDLRYPLYLFRKMCAYVFGVKKCATT